MITYLNDDTEDLMVMISKDKNFSKVIFSLKNENYILDTSPKEQKAIIRKIP